MKFEVVLKGDYKSVSDRLTQMSLNKSQVFLSGFSLNSDWEINLNSNYFEVSKPYKLFDFLGKSQSNCKIVLKLTPIFPFKLTPHFHVIKSA
jgi:hypothetical protein